MTSNTIRILTKALCRHTYTVALFSVSDKCGKMQYTGQSGNFTSPNYPNNYPSHTVCLYTIEATPDTRVGDSVYSVFTTRTITRK